ncbi:kinase-like domain, phloem protein 2-like protein [Tanacetum coccineum]
MFLRPSSGEQKSTMHIFATWRVQSVGVMMIELDRYSNQKEDVVFEFLLESFSSYHCGDGAIYIEGIEFRAIEKPWKVKQLPIDPIYIVFWQVEIPRQVKLEDIGKLEEVPQVLKSYFSVDQLPTKFKDIFKKYTKYEDLFWFGNVNGKKILMLSAKATIPKFSNAKLYSSRRPIHCSPLNINDITRVPKQREDGWMEIELWKFNSGHELENDSHSVHMKFTNQEGTMSGLIVLVEGRAFSRAAILNRPSQLNAITTSMQHQGTYVLFGDLNEVRDESERYGSQFDTSKAQTFNSFIDESSLVEMPMGSGYQQKDRKPSQNDKTEHGMEKTVQNQGQSPKMSKSESILKNQQSNRSRN